MENILLWCGAITTIAAAVGAIWKWVHPVLNLKHKIDDLEVKQEMDHAMIEANTETNQLLCRGIFCLLEVSEIQIRENPTQLAGMEEKVQKTKEKFLTYMIEGKVNLK